MITFVENENGSITATIPVQRKDADTPNQPGQKPGDDPKTVTYCTLPDIAGAYNIPLKGPGEEIHLILGRICSNFSLDYRAADNERLASWDLIALSTTSEVMCDKDQKVYGFKDLTYEHELFQKGFFPTLSLKKFKGDGTTRKCSKTLISLDPTDPARTISIDPNIFQVCDNMGYIRVTYYAGTIPCP
ncbi:hypothetical protein P3C58_18885 [Mesorhizobium sp. XAP10]|uniref:hypothetical protein n=1 Tax=unclassified Mesorhizobium TaxID=325217 RepID=UPI0023DF6934|nr:MULTISPECIES: hypothetical protein [unclassified Mesorhizobium]MDF3154048.1 hypothetical protein [Mesorhizobium sp. XAP10]MDF3247183.1 hypothetical protein [Mesorhizobium sp. XAP4]